jgi:hypothetical protein
MIRDDVIPEHAEPYPLERFDEFSTACVQYIAARRREWQAAFGDRQLAATTQGVHEEIILPLCQGHVEKAG